MNESAKKKLIQKKLPFASSAVKSPATDKSSPNVVGQSRKRKPSNDGNNHRSKKRVTESKENIANQVFDVEDTDEELIENDVTDQEVQAIKKVSETTPNTDHQESVLHIKLPSHSKSKRKSNTELKPAKPTNDASEDDSVVYLGEEELSSVKKVRKSEKKKKQSGSKRKPTNRTLLVDSEDPVAEPGLEISTVETVEPEQSNAVQAQQDSDENISKSPLAIRIEKVETLFEGPITSIPTEASTQVIEDPDSIHDEIIEMLSDDSDRSGRDTSMQGNDVNKTPTAGKLEGKNLTPKQLAWRKELDARRQEKELQRQKEREAKELQRIKEKEQRDEAKRKEKEEKEEARKKEKEERDRKRQAELDKKKEENRIKEEERKVRVYKRLADQRDEEKRQKDEEKRLKDEEKRLKEEAQKRKELEDEARKKKAAEAFTKFFVPKKKTETSPSDDLAKNVKQTENGESAATGKFMAFQVREGTKLAPLVRMRLTVEQKAFLEDNLDKESSVDKLYLKEIKEGLHKPIKSSSAVEKDDDVIVIDELEGAGEDIQADESKLKMKHRAKYFLFVENRRPAFHGTWRKKSSTITARRPLSLDSKYFEYEIDSDDEWEEEEPGESLHGSDSEKEKDGDEDDYEIDNDFMVPHGHLSDEELQQNEDDVIEDNHPEAQKAKLKILQQEFAAEMKKKTEKIKPRLIGCIWMNGDEDEEGCSKSEGTDKKYHCSDIIWRILKAREMMTSEDGVKLQVNIEPEIAEPDEEADRIAAPKQLPVRAKLDDDHVKELIKLVHGNTNGRKYIIREYNAYRLKNFHQDPDFKEFPLKTVDDKMVEISSYKTCPEEGPMFGKKCWLVKPEIIQQHYADERLQLPNDWKYILQKEVKEKKPRPASIAEPAKPEEVSPKDAIADTTEVLRSKTPPASPKPIPVKKRVQLLMSVPRGQEISQAKKNNLISQYLKNGSAEGDQAIDDEVISID